MCRAIEEGCEREMPHSEQCVRVQRPVADSAAIQSNTIRSPRHRRIPALLGSVV